MRKFRCDYHYVDDLVFRYEDADGYAIHLTHPAHVLDTSHTYSHVPPLMRSPHHGNCIPQDTQGGFIHSRLFASTDLYQQHLPV